MTERWRQIPGFVGHYEASDMGRIRSVDRVILRRGIPNNARGRVLRPKLDRKGYPTVNLSIAGASTMRGVHQLVLLAFVGPRPEGMLSRHLNGNPADPRLVNLEYATPSDNQQDTVKHGANPHSNQTCCIHGHPFSGNNLRWSKPKAGRARRRYCRTCQRRWRLEFDVRRPVSA